MNIKICHKCGIQHNNIDICTNCGSVLRSTNEEQKVIQQNVQESNKAELLEEQLTPEQQLLKERNDLMKGNTLAVISIMLIFGGVFFERAFIMSCVSCMTQIG